MELLKRVLTNLNSSFINARNTILYKNFFKKKQLLKESKKLEEEKMYAKKLETKYGRTLNGNKP